ncbi:MAG TPA: HNH endonuclease signature motif containing protein [Aeromicrobium sp.]|nr:HNH endonuclease signature motif containing protein [Aeromicrobium sp.]HKY57619.1 HNH endonuclease signature motif containing protein [Aeromicrobium sp.]
MSDVKERFKARFSVAASGCWEWNGYRDKGGYGRFSLDGQSRLAHRVSYALFVGEIPEGLTLDHLCRNRCCVNPSHLEPVTQRINNIRGLGPTSVNAHKTHCKRGHEFTPDNIYVHPTNGGRVCRICKRTAIRLKTVCPHCGLELLRENVKKHNRRKHPTLAALPTDGRETAASRRCNCGRESAQYQDDDNVWRCWTCEGLVPAPRSDASAASEEGLAAVIRDELVANGLEQGSSLHSWRCDYPDYYGKCDCLDELVADLVAAIEKRGQR